MKTQKAKFRERGREGEYNEMLMIRVTEIYIYITGCRGGGGGEEWDLLRRGRSGRAWRMDGDSSSSGGGSSCRSVEARHAWGGSATGPRLPSWCNWPEAHPPPASTALSSAPPCYSTASSSSTCPPPPTQTHLRPLLMAMMMTKDSSCPLLLSLSLSNLYLRTECRARLSIWVCVRGMMRWGCLYVF